MKLRKLTPVISDQTRTVLNAKSAVVSAPRGGAERRKMKRFTPASILEQSSLRDTQTRRLVIEAFRPSRTGMSVQEIFERITTKGNAINLTTVYRIVEKFAQEGIVHMHPTTGLFSLCSMPERSGHHGFLTCNSCGKMQEFHNANFCKLEHATLERAGFSTAEHLTHIIGRCRTCS